MKASMRYANEVPDDLYIPHGSDESLSNFTIHYKTKNFISHMVQMKVKEQG